MIRTIELVCVHCKGKGKVGDSGAVCPLCGGSGYRVVSILPVFEQITSTNDPGDLDRALDQIKALFEALRDSVEILQGRVYDLKSLVAILKEDNASLTASHKLLSEKLQEEEEEEELSADRMWGRLRDLALTRYSADGRSELLDIVESIERGQPIPPDPKKPNLRHVLDRLREGTTDDPWDFVDAL